ncbi:hypothetical protein WICPIJ_008339, partial [Wickerhamomyces pijperi]
MGAELSLLAPTAPSIAVSAYIDVLDQIQYHKQMGSSRFLKTIKAKDTDGSIVVKVFIKPNDTATNLSEWSKRLQKERDTLLKIPGTAPFLKILETERAGYLIRQFFKSNLYDRISTRPFLKDMEKKWIVFQLLKALEGCHKSGIVHGDLKTENVLVTTWNWVLLSDFSSFKPVYLPIDNPGIFSFYFDSSQRRTCYLAPERFTAGDEVNITKEAKLDPKMDIFSLGCVIAELFHDGAPTFTLSQLFKYKNGELPVPLSGIRNSHLREMVSSMLSINPDDRLTAGGYLGKFKKILFPESFYDFTYDFFSDICSTSIKTSFKSIESSEDCDERISKIYDNFEQVISALKLTYQTTNADTPNINIIGSNEEILPLKLSLPGVPADYQLQTTNSVGKRTDCSLMFLSLVCTSLRNVKYELSKIKALELILALSEHLSDEDKLDRCLPYIIHLFSDPSVSVKTMAIKCLTQLLLLVDSITSTNIEVFPEYILPRCVEVLQDKSGYVRMVFANCFPYLAQISLRFHDYSKVLLLNSRLDASVVIDSDLNLNESMSRSMAFAFDSSIQRLCTEFESLSISLLTDPDSSVKIALLRNILPLCSFFGQDRTNDLILLHLITYLNDKDPALRAVFIESVIGLSVYAGVTSLEHYILPLLVQTLTDPEELIVVKVLKSFQDLIKLGLIRNQYIWDLSAIFTKLILHPNDWIKQFSLQLVVDITENMSFADVYCMLYPVLRQYLDYDVTEFTWESLYSITKRQLSRTVYNLCLTWCSKAGSGEGSLFWKKVKSGNVDAFGNNGLQFSSVPVEYIGTTKQSNKNHSIIFGNLEILLSNEDKVWVDKLIRSGLSEQELWKIADFRDYFYRVSTLLSRANSQTSEVFGSVNLRQIGVLAKNVFFDTKRNIESDNFNTIDISQLDERFQSFDIPESLDSTPNSVIDDRLLDSNDASNSNSGFEITKIPSPSGSAFDEPSKSLIIGVSSKASATLNMNDSNAYGQINSKSNHSAKKKSNNITIEAQQLAIGSQSQITPISHSYIGKDPYIIKFLNSVNFEPSLDEYKEFQKLPARRSSSSTAATVTSGSLGQHHKPDLNNWIPQTEIVSRLVEHEASITAIDTSPDYKVFITGDEEGLIKIWDISKLEMNVSQESLLTVDLSSCVIKLQYLKNHNSFVVATKDGLIRIMSLKFTKLQPSTTRSNSSSFIDQVVVIRQLQLSKEYAVDFTVGKSTAKTHLIYIATNSSQILVIDIRTMTIQSSIQNDPSFGYLTSFDIDDTHCWLICGTSKGVINLWDIRFGLLLKSWRLSCSLLGSGIRQVQVLPNRYQLSRKKGRFAMINDGENLYIIDVSQGLVREVFESQTNPSNLDSVKDYQLLEITPQDQLSSLSSTSLKHQSFFITFQIIESNHHHTSIHTIITTIDKEFIIWDLENPARSLKFL